MAGVPLSREFLEELTIPQIYEELAARRMEIPRTGKSNYKSNKGALIEMVMNQTNPLNQCNICMKRHKSEKLAKKCSHKASRQIAISGGSYVYVPPNCGGARSKHGINIGPMTTDITNAVCEYIPRGVADVVLKYIGSVHIARSVVINEVMNKLDHRHPWHSRAASLFNDTDVIRVGWCMETMYTGNIVIFADMGVHIIQETYKHPDVQKEEVENRKGRVRARVCERTYIPELAPADKHRQPLVAIDNRDRDPHHYIHSNFICWRPGENIPGGVNPDITWVGVPMTQCNSWHLHVERVRHIYNETIDAAVLNWICENPPADVDADDMVVARSMLAKLRKDKNGAWRLRTAYFQRAGIDVGRYVVAKRCGLQALKHSMRAAVAGAFYDYIDIVNSGAYMLKRLCQRRNYATPYLDEYIANHGHMLGEIMRIFHLDRDEAKKGIITIMNGGFPAWARENQFMPWLRRFSEEIRNFAKVSDMPGIFSAADIHKFATGREEKYGKTTNHECVIVGRTIFMFENKILQYVLARLKKDGHVADDVVLCFDGLMIPKGRVDTAYLRVLEAEILEKAKISIPLTFKPFGRDVAVPQNLPTYDPNIANNDFSPYWPPQFVRMSDGRAFNLVDFSYEDDGASVTLVKDDGGCCDVVHERQIGNEWQLRGCNDPSLVESLICENFDI